VISPSPQIRSAGAQGHTRAWPPSDSPNELHAAVDTRNNQ
jgi:hypothetical protein